MGFFYDFLSIILLSIIVYQDFKYKAISWIIFPVIFLFAVLAALQQNLLEHIAKQFLLNMGFIMLQLILVTAYFSIKHRKLIPIGHTYLGLGDLLFFVLLAASFSFINFIFVYMLSLFIIAAIFMLYRFVKKNVAEQIPLAGGMAVVMILCLIIKNAADMNFHDDSFALSFSSRFLL